MENQSLLVVDFNRDDIFMACAVLEALEYPPDAIVKIEKLLNDALNDNDRIAFCAILGMIGEKFLLEKNILQ